MGIKRLVLYYQLFGLIGLWYWLATKTGIIRKPYPVLARHSGFDHPIHLRLNTSDIKVFQHVVLEDEYDVSLFKAPNTIIDAGANIGLSSLQFARKYPQALILAVEPEYSNYELCCSNVKPYPNIIPINAALWNKDTEIAIVDPGLDKWGFQVTDANTSLSPKKVKAVSVDSLIKKYELNTIDILKVDIEGAEKEVFDNSDAWIDKVSLIIIEVHDRIKLGCTDSLNHATKMFVYRQEISSCNFILARTGQVVL